MTIFRIPADAAYLIVRGVVRQVLDDQLEPKEPPQIRAIKDHNRKAGGYPGGNASGNVPPPYQESTTKQDWAPADTGPEAAEPHVPPAYEEPEATKSPSSPPWKESEVTRPEVVPVCEEPEAAQMHVPLACEEPDTSKSPVSPAYKGSEVTRTEVVPVCEEPDVAKMHVPLACEEPEATKSPVSPACQESEATRPEVPSVCEELETTKPDVPPICKELGVIQPGAPAEDRGLNDIQPEVWPTDEELNEAMQTREYKEGNFHFAIAGSAGSSKSSLLNSFRGLNDMDPGHASTGVTETTKEIVRYLPADNSLLGSRGIWYDIPGSGTPDQPDKSYFNDHGLYIFDCIIILIRNRFCVSDLELIKHCNDWKIPFYIVRSKSDEDIRNEFERLKCSHNTHHKDSDFSEDEEEELDKKTKAKLMRQAREKYVTEVREDFKAKLQGIPNKPQNGQRNLEDTYIYLVSKKDLLKSVKKLTQGIASLPAILAGLSSSDNQPVQPLNTTDDVNNALPSHIDDSLPSFSAPQQQVIAQLVQDERYIDELKLINDLMMDLASRRNILPGSIQKVPKKLVSLQG